MQKWKKIGLGVLCGATVVTALYYTALISLPNVIDLNKYKESVSQAIEKETGFKVACENISFKKSLTPYLKIHMYHTLVLYPNDEVFLKLNEVDLKVKLLPLLFKKIEIKDTKLTRPIINITLHKDFSTSLEKYIDINKTINTNGFKFNSLIYDTLCERYKIKFNDETTGKIFYLEGDELLLKDLKLNDKAHVILKGSLFEGDNEYIKYDIDVISALNSDKKHFAFSPFKPLLESGLKANIYGHLVLDKSNNINGNLKVSDLSLTLDNVLLGGNEANLNFKGQEVDIDAKLHTSKTDNAIVKGKFNFGNKKYIDLNTNAKNVNLENLLKIISEVSEILNIQNPLSEIKLKGFLNANFNLNSDFKKLKSSGNAKLINAIISHKSLPYSIDNISANINLDDNKIKIKEATAMINNTPIQIEGVINEDVSFDINTKSQNLELKNIINLFKLDEQLPIDIISGNLSFNTNIKGIINKAYKIKSNTTLSSFKFNDKEKNIPVYIETANITLNGTDKNYYGEIACNNLNITAEKQKISTANFNLSFDNEKISIPTNKIDSFGEFKISGIINDYMKNPNGYINFNGSIPSSNMANMLKQHIKFPYKALGEIKTTGQINFSKDKINLKSQLNTDKENYLSYVVVKELLNKNSLLDINLEIHSDAIEIKDFSIYENLPINKESKKKILNAEGNILLGAIPIFKDIKISIPEELSIATNFLGGEELSLSANLIINKTLETPEINGEAKIYQYNIKKFLTSVKNAQISFNENNIRIIAPDVLINDSALNLIADIKPQRTKNETIISNLQLNSMNLDLNSLFNLIEKERNPFGASKLTIEKGIATINNFKILDLKANDISSDFIVEDNIIKLSNIMASAYGGTIEGNLNYSLNEGQITGNIVGKNVDIKNSLFDLCKIKDNLEGRADFGIKFSLLTGLEQEVLKSLTGNMQFNAKNGKMGTLGKFEYYLYAQNLFYHGILNATLNRIADTLIHNNTAHYREAYGNIFFQNGYIITDTIQTQGDDMSLFVKGRYNMLTNQANVDIYGRISDEIKNKLGSFGNISLYELINGEKDQRKGSVSYQSESTINKIPILYKQADIQTNTFKVNIYGDINSLSAINSFEWIISDRIKKQELPSFSDITQDNL